MLMLSFEDRQRPCLPYSSVPAWGDAHMQCWDLCPAKSPYHPNPTPSLSLRNLLLPLSVTANTCSTPSSYLLYSYFLQNSHWALPIANKSQRTYFLQSGNFCFLLQHKSHVDNKKQSKTGKTNKQKKQPASSGHIFGLGKERSSIVIYSGKNKRQRAVLIK